VSATASGRWVGVGWPLGGSWAAGVSGRWQYETLGWSRAVQRMLESTEACNRGNGGTTPTFQPPLESCATVKSFVKIQLTCRSNETAHYEPDPDMATATATADNGRLRAQKRLRPPIVARKLHVTMY